MICCHLVQFAAARHHSKSPLSAQTPGYHVAYVGNIDFDATADHVREVFTGCGVTTVRLHTDKVGDRATVGKTCSVQLQTLALSVLVQQGQAAKLQVHRRSLLIRCLALADTGHRRLQRVCSCALPRRGVPGQGRGKERHQSLWSRPQGRLCTEKEMTAE